MAVAPPRSLIPRRLLGMAGAGLAGLLGGLDVLLLVVLESLFKGSTSRSGDMAGAGIAAWSAENGLGHGFMPAAVAVLAFSTVLGVAVGWAVVSSRGSGRPFGARGAVRANAGRADDDRAAADRAAAEWGEVVRLRVIPSGERQVPALTWP